MTDFMGFSGLPVAAAWSRDSVEPAQEPGLAEPGTVYCEL